MITMDPDKAKRKGKGYLGKLRSNFLGTEFNIFDDGENPKNSKLPQEKIRNQYGAILYVTEISNNQESNVLGSNGPRKMRCLLPNLDEYGRPEIWKPTDKGGDGLVEFYNKGETNKMFYFTNKPPKWNEGKIVFNLLAVQAFVLNFGGRVDKASVKNFQLIEESNGRELE
jgi:tubby-related protein 1